MGASNEVPRLAGQREGAGRPVGSKSKATLAKEAAREVVRQATLEVENKTDWGS
jgi:hypothetical protein